MCYSQIDIHMKMYHTKELLLDSSFMYHPAWPYTIK